VGPVSGGKLGRLRRVRVGLMSVPVSSTERMRGPRAKSALKLKAILNRRTPVSGQYTDFETYEPPMRKDPPSVRMGRAVPGGLLGGHPTLDDDGDDE
jgi:hypothetical protein